MRFRRLSKEELVPLEEDFIQFLAAHQITAKDWVDLKKNNIPKVDQLVEVFSDIVLEKVFSTIQYLQHRTKDTIRVFYCQEEKITMTGLQISDPSKDLTDAADLALLTQANAIEGKVKLFQIDKVYSKQRSDEVFAMMHKDGCRPAPKGMFEVLESMYAQSS
jgi:hypothetical protein